MKFFELGNIGKLKLRNRIVMAAMGVPEVYGIGDFREPAR